MKDEELRAWIDLQDKAIKETKLEELRAWIGLQDKAITKIEKQLRALTDALGYQVKVVAEHYEAVKKK